MSYYKKIVNLLILFVSINVFSQSFVNGSFEVTTASMTCNYNLDNATFNGLMSNVTAFGAGNEMDILIDGCYTSLIPDGVRAAGIAGSRDEIAMDLTAPLTVGEEYTISFWTRSEISFRPRGDVEVGCSTSPTDFGTSIFVATTVEETWVNHVFTFTATEASTYITVRNVAGAIHWNHIDNFVMEVPVDDLDITSTAVSCFGECDGEATVTGGVLPPYTYLWDAAAGGATDATATGLCAGDYSVEVTNGSGTTTTLEVTVTAPDEIVGTIDSQMDVSCSGLSDGSFSVSGVGGTGILTYDIGTGDMATGVFTDLIAATYNVEISDESGCSIVVPVVIEAPEELVLTATLTNLSCNASADGMIEVSATGGTGGYEYAIDGGSFSPMALFTELDAGMHTVIGRDENGCETTEVFELTEPTVLTATEAVVNESCLGDCLGEIELTASGGTGTYTYSIDGCVTSSMDTEYSGLCSGAYAICITDENGCNYSNTVTIEEGAVLEDATLDAVAPLCINDEPVTITGATIGTLSGEGIVGTTFDPTTVATPGVYTVLNTLADGCSTTESITIVVNAIPSVTFVANETNGCLPHEVEFINTGDVGVTCEWSFGDGTTSSSCGLVNHTYDTEGLFDVSLNITDGNGCKNEVDYNEYISVSEVPSANFGYNPTEITTLNPLVNFINTSTNESSWNWEFDSLGNSSEEHPTFLFPEQAGNYDIKLTVFSENGCANEITKRITVYEEPLIYVPNVFTPDGDTYNEIFLPYLRGNDIYDYHFVVFNRWGELVFESYDQTVGWNGTYGGELVQDGTYIWQITIADIQTDEKKSYNGHINVFR